MNTNLSSSKKIAKIAIWLMWIVVALYPVVLIAGHYLDSKHETTTTLTIFLTLLVIYFVCLGIFIISLIMFLVWFYKAYSNIYELIHEPKYKKWWAIASWLVPVVNFFVPYFILKYMYLKAADLAGNPLAAERIKKWATLNVYWALWILAWICDIVYYVIIFPDMPVAFEVFTCILIVPGAWFTAKIIWDYCELEEEFLHEH
ncbi:MAG: DUF4328 domain-containing protein [Campylobacteraceae bacterium]|jgi:hypothetical protein|nr:DUF4328 domain-containing protein [Campylobacteraceae bacterium]